ncbi:carbohydrate-binding protein [Chitinibacter bivalviorum]|uniref:Carbohydrate-binding protein n=1 Tax=Chitinibacter bivalviorum TaxID=2739434 RepID=A0A7H9BF00_9NEIS|nr:carbohydrate-binding protein [Chitinibacter bivalviorum]QLG86992.1 carbohydrate-binding protein [Chitinibacter bivalviorum]
MSNFTRFIAAAIPAAMITAFAHAGYPAWVDGGTYNAGTIVSYAGNDYQALVTQTDYLGANWNPAATPSLWKLIGPDSSSSTPAPTATPAPTVTPAVTPIGLPTPSPTAKPTATPVSAGSCVAAWNSGTAYTGGQTASYNGHNYKAQWWTQNEDPSTHSGTSQPWSDLGSCTGGPATATPTATPKVTPVVTNSPTPVVTTSPTPTPTTSTTPAPSQQPGNALSFSYGAYKDVTVSTNWNNLAMQGVDTSGKLLPIAQAMPAGMKTLTWAFVTGECGSNAVTPAGENVAGMNPVDFAAGNMPSFISSGKTYIVAVGGAAGKFTCATDAGFTTFLSHYNSANMVGVDFDIEGGRNTAAEIASMVARVKTAQQTYPNMRFSFTIPTLANNNGASVATDLGAGSPDPLGSDGQMVMAAIKAAGLKNYIINLMAMDYGAPKANVCVVSGGSCQMGQSAIQAAMNLHNFYGVPYNQIELTPEIPSDDVGAHFSTDRDIPDVAAFIKANGLAGLHYWSYERDTTGLPYANGFAKALGQ